jgi:hypothetical protein
MRASRLIVIAALALGLLLLLASTAAARSRDRNHDRIPDRWEHRHHLSLRVNQANRDQDRDHLVNLAEFRSGTDPRDADSDDDGVEDADENRDGDGVDNANEAREHTNPAKPDSDGDGKGDGREDADHDGLNNADEDRSGSDPIDPDTDDDGVEDGDENAGKVASFENGVLTIGLAGGGTVSGKVTNATEIKCETEDEHEVENEDHQANASDDGDDGDHGNVGDQGDQGDDEHGDEDNVCTTADLKRDTPVHEAELKVTAEGAVFEEIQLLG